MHNRTTTKQIRPFGVIVITIKTCEANFGLDPLAGGSRGLEQMGHHISVIYGQISDLLRLQLKSRPYRPHRMLLTISF
jgi:hypothetical protein